MHPLTEQIAGNHNRASFGAGFGCAGALHGGGAFGGMSAAGQRYNPLPRFTSIRATDSPLVRSYVLLARGGWTPAEVRPVLRQPHKHSYDRAVLVFPLIPNRLAALDKDPITRLQFTALDWHVELDGARLREASEQVGNRINAIVGFDGEARHSGSSGAFHERTPPQVTARRVFDEIEAARALPLADVLPLSQVPHLPLDAADRHLQLFGQVLVPGTFAFAFDVTRQSFVDTAGCVRQGGHLFFTEPLDNPRIKFYSQSRTTKPTVPSPNVTVGRR